jgi:uncharacterized membrane protein
MTPKWERLSAPQPHEPVLMDAVLAPNRSLSIGAFKLLFGTFAFANAVMAIFFLAHGMYPVSGFMGLDVLAFGLAFRASYRSGRARERVRVSPASVQVTHRKPNANETHWAVSPLWARVVDDPKAVRISAGGSTVRVGGFLSPDEREAFAQALKLALASARVQRPQD